jgi:hypothetical protein
MLNAINCRVLIELWLHNLVIVNGILAWLAELPRHTAPDVFHFRRVLASAFWASAHSFSAITFIVDVLCHGLSLQNALAPQG